MCPNNNVMSLVLQGTDLLDGWRSFDASRFHYIFCKISIFGADQQPQFSATSCALPYNGTLIDFYEEEFLFEEVVQTCTIQLDVFSNPGDHRFPMESCGTVAIPIKRLEENTPV
jgi:hypothetical protein